MANCLMLVRQRVDALPQQVDTGYHRVQEQQNQGRMARWEAANPCHFEKAYRSMPLYLPLSKKATRNKPMTEAFDRGMEKLHQMGRLE